MGGQPIDKVDLAAAEFDFLAVQEIARTAEPGFDEHKGENFQWFQHRHVDQYRGVAIAVSHDLVDCVVDKMHSWGAARPNWGDSCPIPA